MLAGLIMFNNSHTVGVYNGANWIMALAVILGAASALIFQIAPQHKAARVCLSLAIAVMALAFIVA